MKYNLPRGKPLAYLPIHGNPSVRDIAYKTLAYIFTRLLLIPQRAGASPHAEVQQLDRQRPAVPLPMYAAVVSIKLELVIARPRHHKIATPVRRHRGRELRVAHIGIDLKLTPHR